MLGKCDLANPTTIYSWALVAALFASQIGAIDYSFNLEDVHDKTNGEKFGNWLKKKEFSQNN